MFKTEYNYLELKQIQSAITSTKDSLTHVSLTTEQQANVNNAMSAAHVAYQRAHDYVFYRRKNC
ncbi:hypothetical protein [Geomicrobium sp. JCM 19038]|uniref:hypothetical protein n=1 Tax=Geomicrobium sp. JCM 19038 TaxID=1460635 RepID=UPI00045F4689|nr:hypothetical protein [Geomicrobium sp. JCM 19038]GAK06808.1 hypothetical protein JCM19038_517 [Geomicrobium sp. JCM 19038]